MLFIHIYSLRHPADSVTYLQAHYDKQVDRFLIATGIMNERSSSRVIIWTSASGGHSSDENSEDGAWEDGYQPFGRVSASTQSCFAGN